MIGGCVVLFFCKRDDTMAVLRIKSAGSNSVFISPCENLDFKSTRTIIEGHL